MDAKIKLLLLYINVNSGKDISLIKEMRYSPEYRSIRSTYKLTTWMHRKTKKGNITCYPVTKEFKNQIGLVKYLLAIKDGKGDDTNVNKEE